MNAMLSAVMLSIVAQDFLVIIWYFQTEVARYGSHPLGQDNTIVIYNRIPKTGK